MQHYKVWCCLERFNSNNVYKNCKTKHYTDGTTNSTVCIKGVFKSRFDESEEVSKREKIDNEISEQRTQAILDYLESKQTMDYCEWYETKKEREKLLPRSVKEREEKPVRYDSLKRAKDSIFDYVLNNDFEYFFTGTINPESFDSKDPKVLLKPLQNWLKHMVQRYNMDYIMIAELHKSGRIHFHGLFRADNLRLIDSGTKLYKGYGKPVSNERAELLGLTDGRTVYNLATWKFGFSTCVKLVGDKMNTAFYVTKYITKDCKKIFGKFFWHNRGLKKPTLSYSDVDFDAIDSMEHNGFKYVFTRGEM